MTKDLKKYVDSLNISIYRMSDGSLVIAEESHRDVQDNYVILNKPLQIVRVIQQEKMCTAFVPWMIGIDDRIRVNINSIMVDNEAPFEYKYAYCRYNLVSSMQNIMSPSELKQLLSHDVSANSNPSGYPLPPNLVNNLNSQRLDLN